MKHRYESVLLFLRNFTKKQRTLNPLLKYVGYKIIKFLTIGQMSGIIIINI